MPLNTAWGCQIQVRVKRLLHQGAFSILSSAASNCFFFCALIYQLVGVTSCCFSQLIMLFPGMTSWKRKALIEAFFKMDVRVCKNLCDLAAFYRVRYSGSNRQRQRQRRQYTQTHAHIRPIRANLSLSVDTEVDGGKSLLSTECVLRAAGRSSPPLPLNHSGAGSALGPHRGKPASPNLSLRSDTPARSCWILI